jgi:hypothetical protein
MCFPGKLPAVTLALVMSFAAGGCDTRKRVEAPQGDTPVDTGQAPAHVRMLGDGGGSPTGIYAMRPTTDGGYVAVGYTDDSPWIIKAGSQGSLEWQQRFEGFGETFGRNRFNDVQLASDGGFVAAGRLSDRAVVLKFRADGSVAWQWSASHAYLAPQPPDADGRPSAEAMAIAVNPDGAGYTIAGSFGRIFRTEADRLTDGTWLVELTADGRQGREILGLPPNPPIQFERGEIHGLHGPEGDGGILTSLAAWSIPGRDGDDIREGVWYAGSSAAGELLVGQAQHRMRFPWVPPESMWKRSFGPGTFHALRLVERALADGTREQRLLLAGETPAGILVCELRASTGDVVWAREISGVEEPYQAYWRANAIDVIADGGYVLAATSPAGPAVIRLDRDGAIQWQYEYLPPSPGGRADRGQAFAVHGRPDGGFRVAGMQSSEHSVYGTPTQSGFYYFQDHATVFDIDAQGAIDINAKSGWTRRATLATSVVAAPVVLDSAGDFGSADMTHHPDTGTATPVATNVIVETVSGADGVLAAPPVGTNAEGESFYWGNVAGASGFIVFHSEDGVAFTRNNRTQVYDFDLRGNGYYRLVAFNGAGYSDYSPIMGPLGSAVPPPPGGFTLNVTNRAGGGYVNSTPPGISCGIDCTEQYAPGTEVELRLTEGEYLRFTSWGVGCRSSAGTQCIVLMDRDVTVTVNYSTPP